MLLVAYVTEVETCVVIASLSSEMLLVAYATEVEPCVVILSLPLKCCWWHMLLRLNLVL